MAGSGQGLLLSLCLGITPGDLGELPLSLTENKKREIEH